MQVRRVDCTGHISWKHVSVFLSDVLTGERVGLLPVDERHYEVYFVSTPLARFDSHQLRMERLPNAKRERRKNRGGNVEISNSEIPTFPPHDYYEVNEKQPERTKV